LAEPKKQSTTEWLFQEMIERIRSRRWAEGEAIPSERTLMEEFGVSRISVRETLSMLRALGVLETSHGRSSIVRRMDSEIIGRLFPLILSLEGEQSYEQIFEVRLALESQTAYLAAVRRTEEDVARLDELLSTLRIEVEEDLEQSIETDLAFHVQIARATGNPLFPVLLETLSGFVTYVQLMSCRNDPEKRHRALGYHESIAEAIRVSDPDRARTEMEAHLRSSADRMMRRGLFKTAAVGGR